MENQFGKKEKILVGAIVVFTIIFIPYLFVSDRIKREKSIGLMEKASPAIQCGIECQVYNLDSPEGGECIRKCLNPDNINKPISATIVDTGSPVFDGCGYLIRVGNNSYSANIPGEYLIDKLEVEIEYEKIDGVFSCSDGGVEKYEKIKINSIRKK